MKKTVLISLAAVAMLSSCSNDDVVDVKAPNAIGFSTFVNKSTRGEINSENITNFAVYGTQTQGETTQNIFTNELVSGSGTGDSGSWSYTNTQYWVDGADYKFYAIGPVYGNTEGGKADTEGSKIGNWEFSLTDKTVTFNNEGAKADVDLIYSYRNVDKATSPFSVVGFTFNHLLSRVKFRLTNTTGSANTTIVIKDITIKDAYKSGTIDVSKIGETVSISDKDYQDITWGSYGDKELYVGFGDITIANAKTDDSKYAYIIPNASSETYYTVTMEIQVQATNSDGTVVNYPADTEKYYTKEIKLPPTAMHKGYSYVYTASLSAKSDIPTDPDDPSKVLEPIVFSVSSIADWDNNNPPTTITVQKSTTE
jgi:hypothetical protein